MPIYRWKCAACEEQVDILRSFDEYRDVPKEEETKNKECSHKWEKQIGTPNLARGASWGPGKGYWIWILIPILNFIISTPSIT